MDQFEDDLKNFTLSHPTVTYKLSRRGEGVNDARDIIVQNKTLSADVRYDLVIYKFNDDTKLDLDCIYDETHKTGGCSTDDKGVKVLFEGFKNNFLVQLQKEQHIELTPNFFNF